MFGILRPSGGLLYHLRALRSRKLWRDFAGELEIWLSEWKTPSGKLILLGPSGGYTLPSAWLRGFSEIHAFDIDPLAPWLFSLRHPGVDAGFERHDVFWQNGHLTTAPLEAIVRAHPGATLLFCNVLGQLPLENRVDDGDMARYLKQLRASLHGVSWASYHDLYTVEPLAPQDHRKVAQVFCSGGDIARGVSGVDHLEVTDHTLDGAWSEGLDTVRFSWPLSSHSLHLIEGAAVKSRT